MADFLLDQRVELGVHRCENSAMLVPVHREIVALEGIVLQVEQLEVVQFEKRIERR